MIRELTETAWSVLDGYRKQEISGQIYGELDDACGMAETQGHLCIVYSVQDRADQAEAELISALQTNIALNRKAHQADNYGNLANL